MSTGNAPRAFAPLPPGTAAAGPHHPADVAMAVRVPPAPELVRPAHVGGAVAFADLVRSGALVRVRGDVAVRPTTQLTPVVRAASLAHLVPERTVIGGLSAAWVHGGTPAPSTVEVIHPLGVHRPPPLPGRAPRQSALLRTEVALLGGVLVTTVERTALDLACLHDPQASSPVLLALVARCELDLDAVRDSLDLRSRRTGAPRARRVLDALAGRLRAAPAGGEPGPRLP
ncbi:hypothetical protein [Oerskovia enterophila]|uniref:AbiEi antitoxin C-terminal domain-containing protein n=1 Tax=Oerskovia enterophila TaxID=43678 RepID=A0A163RMC9_9CELL|nr:hypothetical protein [Oerskovia enterophila]KZM35361.1 hypothetical protein OJAG_19660 [Oerskovia enterophila]